MELKMDEAKRVGSFFCVSDRRERNATVLCGELSWWLSGGPKNIPGIVMDLRSAPTAHYAPSKNHLRYDFFLSLSGSIESPKKINKFESFLFEIFPKAVTSEARRPKIEPFKTTHIFSS